MNLDALNPMQRRAAETLEGPVLILAGAGSGKTRTLTYRIANLIDHGVLPWHILALTFTNKAAKEMLARVEKLVGADAQDMWIGTFHSVCVRILRRDIEKLGYQRSFTIYDDDDQLRLIKDGLKRLSLDENRMPPKEIRAAISDAKNRMLTPDEWFQESLKDYRSQQIHDLFCYYEERLRAANALDFDDLLLKALELFVDHPPVLEYYRQRFQYVHVDEYQDTNTAQYTFVRLLTQEHRNLCVVGDDDQSIYKFRGATIENILSFEKQFPSARTIRLEQNYRSTGHILDASNALIRHNQGRKGKELWTSAGQGDKLKLYVASGGDDEALYVASQMLAGYSRGKKWSDFAVLYRMNAQSNQFEYAFKRNGIPYRVVGGMRFFDRAEVKDMTAYLSVVHNPADDLRLLRIVNNPPRGIGDKTLALAQEIAGERALSLFTVLCRAEEFSELRRAAPKLLAFTGMIDRLRAEAETLPPDELYDRICQESGYVRALEESDSDEARTRLENVGELKTNIVSYMQSTEGEPTLAGFLDEISLYTDLDQTDLTADSAVMMTIHSAKGLEFDTVFLVGMEDGIFPGQRAIGDPEETEEERRLCYVAMTRAKRRLVLTCARERMLFGRTTANPPSRFLDEIPPENMDRPALRRPEPFRTAPESWQGARAPRHGYAMGQEASRPRPPRPARIPDPMPPRNKENPVSRYKVGDRVRHEAFGEGAIRVLTPMGGDALVEIAFDNVGTKRLMMKSAAAHMTKL